MKRTANTDINSRPRKRFVAKRQNIDQIVNQKVKNELAKKVDRKWINISSGPTSIDYAGATYDLLAGIDRGDAASAEFSGSSLQPIWLQMRYRVVAAGSYSTMRVIIGQMIRDRGTGPSSVGALLNSVGSNTAPLTGFNQYGKAWYKILYDRMHTLVTASNLAETHKVFIPGHKFKKVEFDTGTSNPTVLSGGIFMVVVSDDGAVSYPTFEHEHNLLYSD